MILFAVCLISYFIGSIPFGLILTRMAGLGDVRTIGSGNIGATNVMRTGNKKLAALTLLLDGGKGYLAVWLTHRFVSWDAVALICPLLVVIGHIFPIWLNFKGGKGVATAIGAMTAYLPEIGLMVMVVWLITFLIFRISSLSALTGLWLGVPLGGCLYSIVLHQSPQLEYLLAITFMPLPFFLITLLVTWRHKDNIRRLIAGTEPRFGKNTS